MQDSQPQNGLPQPALHADVRATLAAELDRLLMDRFGVVADEPNMQDVVDAVLAVVAPLRNDLTEAVRRLADEWRGTAVTLSDQAGTRVLSRHWEARADDLVALLGQRPAASDAPHRCTPDRLRRVCAGAAPAETRCPHCGDRTGPLLPPHACQWTPPPTPTAPTEEPTVADADRDPLNHDEGAVERAATELRRLERTHGPDLDVMGIDSDVAAKALAAAGVLRPDHDPATRALLAQAETLSDPYMAAGMSPAVVASFARRVTSAFAADPKEPATTEVAPAHDTAVDASALTFAPGCTFTYTNVHGDQVTWTRAENGWTSPDRDSVATDDDVRQGTAAAVAAQVRVETLERAADRLKMLLGTDNEAYVTAALCVGAMARGAALRRVDVAPAMAEEASRG